MAKSYSGNSLSELCEGHDLWSFYVAPIIISKHHHVLYEFPHNASSVPVPHVMRQPKHWDDDHVKMPFSRHNLFPKKGSQNTEILKSRWDIICKALSEPIKSVEEFRAALESYNHSLPDFLALKYLFEGVFEEEESAEFFEKLLPKIIKLALKLPEILPGSLPLLKKHQNKAVSLSQLQVASLLANAFLCTFPWRKDVANTYPGINFSRLYSAHHSAERLTSVTEKLKCILHYFRRVTNSEPKGVITFERIFLPRSKIPRWDALQNNLGNTRVHITSDGTIEDGGLGFLQVDFANKNVGGGVLGAGCVQEEIRFVICPELLISRLFVEQLDDTESVIVKGIERFSTYTGYGNTFTWSGNFVDETPSDDYCRRKTTVTIIDATRFSKIDQQYYPSAVLRELSKAYVGFYSQHTKNLAPVATGNWGCGAFGGDARLKSMIQLMACNAAHRHFVYYTFGNEDLQETFYNMYLFIATNRITTCELWRIICRFANSKLPPDQFYCFIQQSCFDSRNHPDKVQPKTSPLKERSPKKESSSPRKLKMPMKRDNDSIASTSKFVNKTDLSTLENISQTSSNSVSTSSSEDIIPSSQPELEYRLPLKKTREKTMFNKKLFEENHNEILDIFTTIDGPSIDSKSDQKERDTLLSVCEKLEKVKEKKEQQHEAVVDVVEDSMDVDEPVEALSPIITKTKNRITDYFSKLGKS